MKCCYKTVSWLLHSDIAEYMAGAIVALFLIGTVYYIIFGGV